MYLIKNKELLKMTVLFVILLVSAYLLFVNHASNWGILFGIIFVLAIILILVDALAIPVFKEKFFSGVKRRKEQEAMSEDMSSVVLKRANYKCQSCGAPGNKIYHMDREKSHNNPENLLCLCDKCLVKVESGQISGDKLYFMRLSEKNAKQKRV